MPLSPPRTRHKASPLWLVQSGVGLVGSGLNTGVLLVSYKERTSLVPAVNIMLGYYQHNIRIVSLKRSLELPAPYDFYFGVPISHQLTVYSVSLGS